MKHTRKFIEDRYSELAEDFEYDESETSQQKRIRQTDTKDLQEAQAVLWRMGDEQLDIRESCDNAIRDIQDELKRRGVLRPQSNFAVSFIYA